MKQWKSIHFCEIEKNYGEPRMQAPSIRLAKKKIKNKTETTTHKLKELHTKVT